MAKQNKKNKYISYVAIFLVIAFGATYILSIYPSNKFEQRKTQVVKKVNIPFTKHADLQIISSNNDTVHNVNIEIVEDDFHTQQGLMYRSSMKEDNGMLFIFKDEKPRSFWMRNTQIGLDIIYTDASGKIVSMAKYAKPYDETSSPSNYPAKYVLEVNDGMADKWGVKVGDIIKWQRLKK